MELNFFVSSWRPYSAELGKKKRQKASGEAAIEIVSRPVAPIDHYQRGGGQCMRKKMRSRAKIEDVEHVPTLIRAVACKSQRGPTNPIKCILPHRKPIILDRGTKIGRKPIAQPLYA